MLGVRQSQHHRRGVMASKSCGRPTLYKPEYCETVVSLMAGGYSIAGVAGKLGVSRQTVYDWGDAHPEFLDALNTARAASALWWEDRAIELASGTGEGNASVVIFGLKNRVADEWRDKQAHEHSGPDGGAIETTSVSSLELARQVAFMLAQGIEEAK